MSEFEIKKSIFQRSAKFYFFCFMSESKALKLAKSVVEDVFRTPVDGQDWGKEMEGRLLKVMHKTYISNEKKSSQSVTAPMLGHFEIPKSLDLGAWREFKRSAHGNEFYTTCLFYVGGFDLQTIAEIQGVTEGTVKFRLSHGAKKLGSILLKEYLN
ncbi:MAG: sigma-70 region 4 domain-containing protein [Bdellovibrionaceae bacterium]|nr:sigma-70 region 4 domain-containing protein [Pseudobdellovibrionaceae bacterium]